MASSPDLEEVRRLTGRDSCTENDQKMMKTAGI